MFSAVSAWPEVSGTRQRLSEHGLRVCWAEACWFALTDDVGLTPTSVPADLVEACRQTVVKQPEAAEALVAQIGDAPH